MLNESYLGQAVFKVVAFHLDASMKTSLPLLECRVNHSLVRFIPCRHKLHQTDAQWKLF